MKFHKLYVYIITLIFITLLTVDSDSNIYKSYIEVTISKEAGWNPKIAVDTLSRRILGLRWKIKGIGSTGNKFKIMPEEDNNISDARIYQMTQIFKKDPWVISAEAYYSNPNFTSFTGDEGLRIIDNPTWYLGQKGINAYEAWKMIEEKGKKPGEGVIIGLPDTGFLDHPELFHSDGSTNLRLDLQYNFAEPSNPFDAHDFCDTLCGITINKTVKLVYVGHGTTTASMIISPPGKQEGTVGNFHTEGAAQYAEVIPIRVSSSVILNNRTKKKLAKGILYAVDNGARVISISMGGSSNNDYELKDAIRTAYDNGVIIVAAAGNSPYKLSYIPFLNSVHKPASYEETIAVCGSNAYEEAWRDTSRGKEVDICAPAEDIRRARAGWVSLNKYVNDTDRSEGTSMSTALTASVAAMWISYHGYENLLEHYDYEPSKIPEAFRQIIKTYGHRRPKGWNTKLHGAGIIDAALVLKAPLPEL